MIKNEIEKRIKDKGLEETIELVSDNGRYHIQRKTMQCFSPKKSQIFLEQSDSYSISDLQPTLLGISSELSDLFHKETIALEGVYSEPLNYQEYLETAINDPKWFEILAIETAVQQLVYTTIDEEDEIINFCQKVQVKEPPNFETLLFQNIYSCLHEEKNRESILNSDIAWPPKAEQVLKFMQNARLSYNFGKIAFIKSFFCYSYLVNHPANINGYSLPLNLGEDATYSQYEKLFDTFKGKIDTDSLTAHIKSPQVLHFIETYKMKSILNETIQPVKNTKAVKI